ncbi:NS3 [CHeRI orbivirus 1]|nr:NS3 [CHeRI orbivirus 1]
MHAALPTAKRDSLIPMLTVVSASAPRIDEINEEEEKPKRVRFDFSSINPNAGKAAALDVLQSALGSGTGTDEITRRERSAYAAASQALNEDVNTRRLKCYMNSQILPRLKNKLRTVKIKYRILLVIEIFLAMLSTFIFALMATTELEDTVNKYLKDTFGGKVGLPIISMLLTIALLFVSRMTGGMKELDKRLKREITKRETYNHVSAAVVAEAEAQRTESEPRESNLRNATWINAPGTVVPVGGWQLHAV